MNEPGDVVDVARQLRKMLAAAEALAPVLEASLAAYGSEAEATRERAALATAAAVTAVAATTAAVEASPAYRAAARRDRT